MRDGRYLLDQWLMKFKYSGMIPDGEEILEVGTGHCIEHYMMFHDKYAFQPTDITLYSDEVPNMEYLDAHDFSTSPVLERKSTWKAILLSQVLEHAIDPAVVLRECYAHLEDGGYAIVTVPFWYRIHRSGDPLDKETTEREMLDLWRMTDDGLRILFTKAGFSRIYAERLWDHNVEHQYFTPPFVVGWAEKGTFNNSEGIPEVLKSWDVAIPDNWRMIQADLEAQFRRKQKNGTI